MIPSLSLGIDAGGTYTDLVLLDHEGRHVVESVKSPTTRPDPSPGICDGLRRLDPRLLGHVSMVSLATTFATNAIVEELGAEAGLILIGYDRVPEVIPDGTRVMVLSGGHTVSGEERAPLDMATLERDLPAFVQGLDAVAVTGFFSVRNPDHETRVAETVRDRCGLPVVCGHRLSTKLDAFKRATTVWWNARLIPLISNLIRACQAVLNEAGIRAPLMVVRGDGTLMSARTALERPVDTLLSGPAASILGARYLAGVEDCLIVDMGGTTTDMAVLSRGRVLVDPRGASVGQWETHVEAARVRTIGLGGDSLIGVNGHLNLEVGPRRVVPLCVQAERRPELLELLRLVLIQVSNTPRRGANPCSFYLRVEDLGDAAGEMCWKPPEIASEYLLWTNAETWSHVMDLVHQEKEGRLIRTALTPTDLWVADGRLSLGDPEASRLGRSIMAQYVGMTDEALGEAVEETISRRLCIEAASFVAGDDQAALVALADRWYPDRIGEAAGVELDLRLTLKAPVVGVGAPAPACVPRAFRHLGAQAVLPQGYDVSVAIGAVVGLVDFALTGIVRPNESGGFDLFTPAKSTFARLEDALQAGRSQLEAQAVEEMRRNHVASPLIRVRIRDTKARSRGSDLHIETVITLQASGRPSVNDRSAST